MRRCTSSTAWRRWPSARSVGFGALVLAILGSCAQLPSPFPRSTPIPDRPINLAGACSQTEEDGFRENARVSIADNEVRSLSWQLWVGKRGTCRFELADFRQTSRRPHIELQSRDGSGCKLFVWQDPRRITLAHEGCERRCTPGIYDKAWPVIFDPQTGQCSRNLS